MKKRIKKRPAIDERTTGRDDHRTPNWFVVAVSKYKKIGLDPAGSERKDAPTNQYAKTVYRRSRGYDGLVDPWRGFGLVYCNPPYGREVAEWIITAIRWFHAIGRSTGSDELILLTAARVDTRWFKLAWAHATAVLFCNSRFQFVGEKDPAKFPQAILYYGRTPEKFAAHFGYLGLVVFTKQPRTWRQVFARRAQLQFPDNPKWISLLAGLSSKRSSTTKRTPSSTSSRTRRRSNRRSSSRRGSKRISTSARTTR